MSARLVCHLCGKQKWVLYGDAIPEGWTVTPTRCPEHVGMKFAPPVAGCALDHDPEPYSQYSMAGGFAEPTKFDPREGCCRWWDHYDPSPEALASRAVTGGES